MAGCSTSNRYDRYELERLDGFEAGSPEANIACSSWCMETVDGDLAPFDEDSELTISTAAEGEVTGTYETIRIEDRTFLGTTALGGLVEIPIEDIELVETYESNTETTVVVVVVAAAVLAGVVSMVAFSTDESGGSATRSQGSGRGLSPNELFGIMLSHYLSR
jgi:hypothetical protein